VEVTKGLLIPNAGSHHQMPRLFALARLFRYNGGWRPIRSVRVSVFINLAFEVNHFFHQPDDERH
jgi:hypothetical protein